jgi:hypothetical protein
MASDAREDAYVPPIRIHIANVRDDHADAFTIPLPATREALRPFLEGAEIKSWRDIKIEDVHASISGLGDKVYDLLRDTDSPVALNELNLLAAKLIYLDKEETGVFAAALSANLRCGSIAEMINLAENAKKIRLSLSIKNIRNLKPLIAEGLTQFIFRQYAPAKLNDNGVFV